MGQHVGDYNHSFASVEGATLGQSLKTAIALTTAKQGDPVGSAKLANNPKEKRG